MCKSRINIQAVALWGLLLSTMGAAHGGTDHSSIFTSYLVNIENIPSPTLGKVRAIIRDQRGFLWFGTTEGLHKYDGYEVRVFEMSKASYDAQRYVTAILGEGDSSLLLGTWNGLWTFNLKTEQASRYLGGIRFGDGKISALAEDRNQRLWIGTLTAGLFCYDRLTGTMRSYSKRDGLSDSAITTLAIDHSGVVWIGTRRGLNSFAPSDGRFIQYHTDPNGGNTISSDDVTVIHEDGNNDLWVGTRGGLNKIDRQTGRFHRYQIVPGGQNEIWSISHDPSGRLWVGVTEAGLFAYVDGTFQHFGRSEENGRGINDAYIYILYVDPTSDRRDVLLWVGTRDEGVDKVHIVRNPFANFTRGGNLPIQGNGAVLSICQDREGILWVGLWGGGLNALKPRAGGYALIAHYVHDPSDVHSLPNNDVSSIVEDRAGTLWIGTGDGLAALGPSRDRFLVYRHMEDDSSSLPANLVAKIYEDRSGEMWVCTEGGLARLIRGTPNRFMNYLHRAADAHVSPRISGRNNISDITEDLAGNLWASMYGGGMNRIEADGRHTRFLCATDSDGTLEGWIYTVYEDRNGVFWLETNAGLVNFDPSSNSFTRVGAEELHDAHVFGIFEDAAGNIWLSTGIGLIRLDRKTGNFKRYDESRGLPFKELLSPFCRTEGGKVFVGGLDGFTVFDPDRMATARLVPPVAITGFSVFGTIMPAGIFSAPEIRLAYDQNFFSFSFAALDYTDAKRNRYVYRMEGVDPDWVNAGSRNYASYTHLDPGTYLFRVKGCNSDDVWNERGASVRIIIAPPYWQTWWFRFLAAGILGGLSYAVYHYRRGKRLELERLRQRIANDLHDDVGSNLSAIALLSRAAQRSPGLTEETRKKLSDIFDTAVLTSEGMKDIVWFLKPGNDAIDDLLLRMKDTASSLLGDIDHEFRSPAVRSAARVPIEFKRNFFLAFKEILTNIVKHAGARRVEIDVTRRDGALELLVRDDGQGFDEGAVRRGNGLESLRSRARALGGICEIVSRPAQGTTVRFSGRWSR